MYSKFIFITVVLLLSFSLTAKANPPSHGIRVHCLLPQYNVCGVIPVGLIFTQSTFGSRFLASVDAEQKIWSQFSRSLLQQRYQNAISHSLNLSDELRKLSELWIKHYDQPVKLLRTQFPDTFYAREILQYALMTLAKRDLELAMVYFQEITDKYHFSMPQRHVIQSEIAMMLLLQDDTRAGDWWRPIPFAAMSSKLQHWLLRDALRQQDWPLYLARYSALPKSIQNHARWSFWLAYAYAKTNQFPRAKKIWQNLAEQRHFYALVSHHQLQQPIRLHHQQIDHSEREQIKLAKHPQIQQAKQKLQQGKPTLARFHWRQAIQQFSDEQRYLASRIADAWGWHTEAIVTMRKQSYQDDLRLRFPLAHKKHIAPNAQKFGVNPAIIYAIARLESHFRQDAVSPAGAVGVMQLMPKTAQQYLKTYGDHSQLIQAILHLPTNIKIACQHFKTLLRVFNQHPMLAIAAYNAGLGNVKRWLAMNKNMHPLIWIELIPYHETREYVKMVITYTAIYHHHLKLKFDLSKFLHFW